MSLNIKKQGRISIYFAWRSSMFRNNLEKKFKSKLNKKSLGEVNVSLNVWIWKLHMNKSTQKQVCHSLYRSCRPDDSKQRKTLPKAWDWLI